MSRQTCCSIFGFLSALLSVGLWCGVASAQARSLFGNTGGGSGAANSSSQGFNPFQSGTAGVSGNSSINTDAGTTAINTDFGTGLVGRSTATSGFVGTQNASQQGRSNANSTRRLTSTRTQSTTNRNSSGRNTNSRFGTNSRFSTSSGRFGSTTTSLGTFRPQQRIAFHYSPPSPKAVTTTIQVRLDRITSATQRLRGLNVQVGQKGQVTLIGQVESEATRKLAENLIRLEPGVRSIRNELTVQPGSSGT